MPTADTETTDPTPLGDHEDDALTSAFPEPVTYEAAHDLVGDAISTLVDLEPDRTVVQLALKCGARLESELLPVVWADVALDKARLTITATHAKNGRPRHLPLSADMVARLRAMQATSTSPWVFPARQGGFNHRFKRRYFRAVRALGLAGVGDSHPAAHLGLAHGRGGRRSGPGQGAGRVEFAGDGDPLRPLQARARGGGDPAHAGRARPSPQTSPRPIPATPRSA